MTAIEAKAALVGAMGIRGWTERPPPQIGALSAYLQRDGVGMTLHFTSHRAALSLIFVSKPARGKGLFRPAMADLVASADEAGLRLTLSVMPMLPETPDTGTLVRLYSEFGFEPCGWGEDGEPLMARAPGGPAGELVP